MATLKSNGNCIIEMITRRHKSDNADGDPMTQDITRQYRAMSSGKILLKTIVKSNYGMDNPTKYNSGWKQWKKFKKNVSVEEIRKYFFEWQERLLQKGVDAEITA